MNRDLEETLEELGPEYRTLVARLKSAYEPVKRTTGHAGAYLAAASVAVVFALGIVFGPSEKPAEKVYTAAVAPAQNEFMLAHIRGEEAVKEMLRTQRSDGGWGNDFVTRQNAAVLREVHEASAQIAYKRAMRNLRLKLGSQVL